jgi:excisionase family DNA binding protein
MMLEDADALPVTQEIAVTDVASDWMTLEDISQDLRVPVQTLYQWRMRREGPPAHKVGRLVRVRRVDYEAWLASRRDGASE